MDNTQKILEGHSDIEKGAYLGAIASIATADRQASDEEIEDITQLANSAELSEDQKQAVIRAATEMSGEELTHCLDILKNSDLKFSLIADLIAFAKSDSNYSEAEEQNIQKISKYIGVDEKQFSLLDQFAEKTATSSASPEEVAKPSFLSSLGLEDKMKQAGINGGGLLKGLLSIAAPMILTGLVTRGLNRNSSGPLGGGGMFGGGGGMFGGSGGMFGGGGGGMFGGGGGGGLGSVIGMLNGGRGFGSAGGLLGKILGGRF